MSAEDLPGTLDAQAFLRLAARLREIQIRIEQAQLSGERRGRWHRKLIAISEAASTDLARADAQLRRFEAELDRYLA